MKKRVATTLGSTNDRFLLCAPPFAFRALVVYDKMFFFSSFSHRPWGLSLLCSILSSCHYIHHPLGLSPPQAWLGNGANLPDSLTCFSRRRVQRDILLNLMWTTSRHHNYIGHWLTNFVSKMVNKNIMFFIFLMADSINCNCFWFGLNTDIVNEETFL